jgi:hypothetical protein
MIGAYGPDPLRIVEFDSREERGSERARVALILLHQEIPAGCNLPPATQ